MTYNPDNENRLAFVKTIWPDEKGLEISQIIKLDYKDYVNAEGQINNVVVNIEQRTWAKSNDGSNTDFIGPIGGKEDYQNLERELDSQEKDNAINDDWTTPGDLFPDIEEDIS